jgi:predicted nucleotidyltransferase
MESKFTELVERLKAAAAGNLKAAILYGSAVSGDFHEKHSDLNVLCIVQRAAADDLEHLHTVAEWWTRQGNPAPLVFTFDELVRSADVFSIELLDIKAHHRMLFGEDLFAGLDVPLRLHRLQVERELRTDWLRLRQAILAAPRKRDVHLGVMLRSVSAFCVLFRHALIAVGQPAALSKGEAVDGMASLTGANPSAFHAVLDFRAGKRKEKEIDVEATLQTYLEFVEIATNEVDRRFDAS